MLRNTFSLVFLASLFSACSGLNDASTSTGGGSTSSSDSTASCASYSSSAANAELTINSLKIGSTSQGASIAQSFTLTSAKTVSAVAVKLLRLGAPSGTLTLSIQGDSSSAPDGTSKVSTTMDIKTGSTENISTSETFYTFTFNTGVSLSASTVYWIKLTASYGSSATNVIQWAGNTIDGYSSGKAIYVKPDQSTWLDHPTTKDLLFKITCD